MLYRATNAIASSRLGFTITLALCIALVGFVEGMGI